MGYPYHGINTFPCSMMQRGGTAFTCALHAQCLPPVSAAAVLSSSFELPAFTHQLFLAPADCANLTAALTVSQLTTSINSVSDLRGKAVGTVSVYVPRLAKWGIAAVALPFE